MFLIHRLSLALLLSTVVNATPLKFLAINKRKIIQLMANPSFHRPARRPRIARSPDKAQLHPGNNKKGWPHYPLPRRAANPFVFPFTRSLLAGALPSPGCAVGLSGLSVTHHKGWPHTPPIGSRKLATGLHQLFDIALGWQTEKAPILASKLRGAFITSSVGQGSVTVPTLRQRVIQIRRYRIRRARQNAVT